MFARRSDNAIVVPGCATMDIARAQAYIDALAPRCAADQQRPSRHFTPLSRWMNDPNGTIRHAGWFHLFYQLNPFGDTWGFMHWGHARSRDLVAWEHLPIALAPDVLAGEEHCFSGCIATDADGTPRLMYTSVSFADTRPYEQWRASPLDDDLIAWRRDRTPLIGAQADRTARDPFVFRWRGRTLLVLGDGPRVTLFEAEGGDLGRIIPRGTFWQAAPGEMSFAECPNVLVLPDERLVLLLSPYRAVEWRLGTFDGTTLTVQAQGLFDQHDNLYATNTLEEETGRTVVLGWIRHFPAGRGWSGCLSFPRLVEAHGNHLCQRVHPAVESLCGVSVPWNGSPLTIGDGCRVQGRLRPGTHFAVHGHEVAWDGAQLSVDGDNWQLAAAELEIDAWIDRSVIEVFADGGRTVITRVRVDDNADGTLRGAGAEGLTVCPLAQPNIAKRVR
jgi:sucrose-6-phosphate hydrolase SacC (GH32 family)